MSSVAATGPSLTTRWRPSAARSGAVRSWGIAGGQRSATRTSATRCACGCSTETSARSVRHDDLGAFSDSKRSSRRRCRQTGDHAMTRRYLRALPLLPVLVLALLAVWSTEHDLARHEQYAATAAVW